MDTFICSDNLIWEIKSVQNYYIDNSIGTDIKVSYLDAEFELTKNV